MNLYYQLVLTIIFPSADKLLNNPIQHEFSPR